MQKVCKDYIFNPEKNSFTQPRENAARASILLVKAYSLICGCADAPWFVENIQELRF